MGKVRIMGVGSKEENEAMMLSIFYCAENLQSYVI